MIGIGDRPILWHIMKIYSHYGFNDFIICLGYNIVKEFFAGYYTHTSDVTFDLKNNEMTVQRNTSEPWRVTLVDTGLNTMTGGRIKRVQEYIGNEPFMLTYGDGVADIDIDKLLKFHKSHGKIDTLTKINVDQRFGVLDIAENGNISAFREKQAADKSVINGGFMVMNPVDSALKFWLTSGEYTDKFEKGLAEYLGVKYCSVVNSGSSANLLAFMALTSPLLNERAVKPGDEIITVAASFPTTVSPIVQYGAVPVFVDVTIPQYNIV